MTTRNGDNGNRWTLSPPSPRWLYLGIGVVVALQVIWWLSLGLLVGWKAPTLGQYGDLFGGVSALFTGLAFAGLIYTILWQRYQVELTKEELEGSQEALAEQE